MTNLLTVLPDFDIKPFTHILPSLEKALVSSADLVSLDAIDVAKRAQVPVGEVRKLTAALLHGLQHDGQTAGHDDKETSLSNGQDLVDQWQPISTLDEHLDSTLGGGIATGHLTEFVGESAAGKTQCLLTLLLSVQLPPPKGPGKSALYISTEAPLQTTRLAQILTTHPTLTALAAADKPSLNRIHSTHIHDLQAQEHILHYQVPIIVQRHNIGLIVIDSIAANFRPEFDNGQAKSHGNRNGRAGAESFAQRAIQLQHLGRLLHDLARKYNLAVVVANQVSDRFVNPAGSYGYETPASQKQLYPTHMASQKNRDQQQQPEAQHLPSASTLPPPPSAPTATPAPAVLSTDDPLSLDHQQNFFSGWGDVGHDMNMSINLNLKTPSLGLVWTNQLDARIALLKEAKPGEEGEWNRTLKVVFCPWAREGQVGFELWGGGVRGVVPDTIGA